MTSDRAYRRSIGRAEAITELERGATTQFDRQVVEAFVTVLNQEVDRPEVVLV